MKILMVNKYYYVKGGSERYLFDIKALLEQHGHEVIPFAMKDEQNFPSEYQNYFVDHVDYDAPFSLKKLKEAARLIYSLHAREKIEALIEATQPDVAHLHMIDHQISPAILHSLHRYGIPVVQTVHQYKLVCPNYRFYIEHKNQICERCLPKKFYQPILTRCHKNSLAASLLISLEAYCHHWLGTYRKHVRLFHTPSAFMKRMLVAGGIDAQKIEHHFLVTWLDQFPFSPHYEDYFVYLGRLSPEKGVMTLLKAMTRIKKSKLMIIGDGAQRPELERFARDHGISNVQFAGYKNKNEVKELLSHAAFTVVPSEWYENSPLVIYEAFAMGKPVIGATIGGITEFIEPNKDGLHFPAGDDRVLAECIQSLLDQPKKVAELGRHARDKAERFFAPEEHYQWLSRVYERILTA
ncbi:MAG: glycosyltransferase [candidate division KSB1 bacterium]|nr:glycosyltransferase [candidate division KSB1 bacterium]MDZ7357053.1 glycosyltransferase [candidate division KSB1 bacterium]MDZ7398836.1 glycosyltransferase [candidate division KSB1 bacterium]